MDGKEKQPQPIRTSRLLERGESAVAFIGLALAAIVTITVVAGVLWTLRAEHEAVQQRRQQEVKLVSSMLATASASLLDNDDLSSTRRLLGDFAQRYNLDRCRLVLPDGQIVASSNVAEVTKTTMPDTWVGRVPLDQLTALRETGKGFETVLDVEVSNRGHLVLEVEAAINAPLWFIGEAQIGLVSIGAAALFGVLLVYRRTRKRLRAMGAIRESLLVRKAGEGDPRTLTVADQFGDEAVSWNALLEEHHQLRQAKSAEKTLEKLTGQSGTDLRGACDALSQGLLLIDDNHVVRYANGAAGVFLSSDRDEVIGSVLSRFIEDERLIQAVEAAAGDLRQRSTIEVEQEQESGRGVFRFTVRPVRRDDGLAAMVMIEDMTQLRVADEARNQFVAQATHELRTPLTNIRLYLETLLEDEIRDPAEQTNALNVINQESARLERIVGDMLNVAEIEAGSLKLAEDDVHLDVVLEALERDYNAQALAKGIVLAFNLPPKLPVISADRDKLIMAMHNLLGNALKYTESGGRVSINVEVDEATGQLLFEVHDDGIGISPDDQSHVFEKFYRAKDRRIGSITGTGLGLALAREVVRLHGGDITVESELNQGSTFTLSLPAKAA